MKQFLILAMQELDTTTELVNVTVTVYMIFQGLSPTFWGSLADRWGRRPVYLGTMAVYIGANVGLALAPSYAALLVLRMLQAFGSSSVIAIGKKALFSMVVGMTLTIWYRRGSHW